MRVIQPRVDAPERAFFVIHRGLRLFQIRILQPDVRIQQVSNIVRGYILILGERVQIRVTGHAPIQRERPRRIEDQVLRMLQFQRFTFPAQLSGAKQIVEIGVVVGARQLPFPQMRVE